MSFVTLLRCLMLGVLSMVGTSLLLQSPEFMSLIFDAVSLVFVLEVSGLFYEQVLRPSVRDQTGNIRPPTVPKIGLSYLTQRPGLEDFLWLVAVVVTAIIIMQGYYGMSVQPMGEALMCTCLSEGEHCEEANKFGFDFWYDYWKNQTPQVFKDVKVLKESFEEEGHAASLAQVRHFAGVAAAQGAYAAAPIAALAEQSFAAASRRARSAFRAVRHALRPDTARA